MNRFSGREDIRNKRKLRCFVPETKWVFPKIGDPNIVP